MAEYQLKTGKVGKKVVEENKHEKRNHRKEAGHDPDFR